MATSSIRLPGLAVRRSGPSRPRVAGKAKPFLRFYHSDALRTKTLALLTSLEQSPDPVEYRDAFADIVVALTHAGMDYYFMKPLKLTKAGFLIEQTANLGMAAGLQVIGSLIKSIIGRMDKPQLLSASSSLRQMMH